MLEIIRCPHIGAWPDAVEALEQNQAAAAILDICDPKRATSALREWGGEPYLQVKKLPDTLLRAVHIARLRPSDIELSEEDLTERPGLTQGASGLHIDFFATPRG